MQLNETPEDAFIPTRKHTQDRNMWDNPRITTVPCFILLELLEIQQIEKMCDMTAPSGGK